LLYCREFVIGFVYYVICFMLLFRLLASRLPTGSHVIALALLLAFMLVNAAWGWVFFRRKDLRVSFLAFVPGVAGSIPAGPVEVAVPALASQDGFSTSTYSRGGRTSRSIESPL
jgi:hypothetical protein